MKKISCYVSGLEPWGVFLGVLLFLSDESNIQRYKASVEFYNKAAEQLELFLEIYSYNKQNIEKWFARYVSKILSFNYFLIFKTSWTPDRFSTPYNSHN